jgi:hypothetical protein
MRFIRYLQIKVKNTVGPKYHGLEWMPLFKVYYQRCDEK